MTTAAEAVEIALRGVTLDPAEAARLHAVLDARTRRPSARERLDAHLDALRSIVAATWLHEARRLIREALAEQAQQAIAAADRAQLGGCDGYETAQAVRQAMLSDRPGE